MHTEIKVAMIRANLTQQALGDKVGCSKVWLANILNGKWRGRVQLRAKIARELRVSLSWLDAHTVITGTPSGRNVKNPTDNANA